jgi:hypothetical protein
MRRRVPAGEKGRPFLPARAGKSTYPAGAQDSHRVKPTILDVSAPPGRLGRGIPRPIASRGRCGILAALALLMAAAATPAPTARTSAPAPVLRDSEPPLDPLVLRSMRDRLAAGTVTSALAVLDEMRKAPHSRHGLLLWEATVRATLRVEAADRRLPELEGERRQVASELKEASRSTSTSLQKRLEQRLAAIDAERAELAAQKQIESRLWEVCRAGFEPVAAALEGEAADALASALLQKLDEEREPAARMLLVDMAGDVRSPAVMPLLMEIASARAEPVALAVSALRALGSRGDAAATPAAIAALAQLAERVEAEAVEALRRFHRRSSIPLLITHLASAQGRLRDDLGLALRSLTGESFVAEPGIWRDWWDSHQQRFVMPKSPAERPLVPEGVEGGASFFGIGSFSRRVVYVLDVSGSMAERAGTGTDASTRRTKLDVARSHLKSAVAGLARDARFDVVVYGDDAVPAFPAVEPADDSHRTAAFEFVDGRRAVGATNIHSALREAFRLADGSAEEGRREAAPGAREPEVDTIFFLTDGFPTAGIVRSPELILQEVAALNRTRRIRIHTVGVGDHDREFLRRLAAQNGGMYVAR